MKGIRYCRKVDSQEHCADCVTSFPIRKLIVIPLITFSSNFATFFGNSFLLPQYSLIGNTLLDEVILPSHLPQNTELKYQNGGLMKLSLKNTGGFSIKKYVNMFPLPQ